MVVSTFETPNIPKVKYEIEMRYMPSIENNIKHRRVFEDDQQIKRILEVIEEFPAINIDMDEDKGIGDFLEGEVESVPKFNNCMENHKILQLKNNFIPKGLVPLEKLFDRNDVPIKPIVHTKDENVDDCNIGIDEEPKYIKF